MSDKRSKTMMRGALIFGVVAATLELGAVLWMMYC
jgi:hypothetical protein